MPARCVRSPPSGGASTNSKFWPSPKPSVVSGGRGAVPNRRGRRVVTGREVIQLEVAVLLHHFARFGEGLVADVGNREHLAHFDAGEGLEGFGVSHRVDAATHEQVAEHGAGGGVLGHLIHAQFLGARAVFEEEVVKQIENQVRPTRTRCRLSKASRANRRTARPVRRRCNDAG